MNVQDGNGYATRPDLRKLQIDSLLKNATSRRVSGDIVAIIVPHANKLSGGSLAAEVYASISGMRYDTVIIVEPSKGAPFGRIHISRLDEYPGPLGAIAVNDSVRNDLCDEDDDIFLDDEGHFHSDGIDVQLPFLQAVLPQPFDIVPIVMGEESPEFCRELGHAIGEIMYSRRVLLVSTVSVLNADRDALDAIQKHLRDLDESRLMALLNSAGVRVQGKGPMLVSLIAAEHRKANHVDILGADIPANGGPGAVGVVITRR